MSTMLQRARRAVARPGASPSSPEQHGRDAYGFALRPQHLQRYREYAAIYKEEEEERSDRWNDFLERLAESSDSRDSSTLVSGGSIAGEDNRTEDSAENNEENGESNGPESLKIGGGLLDELKTPKTGSWGWIRPSLKAIEQMMSLRVKKKVHHSADGGTGTELVGKLGTIEEDQQPGREDDGGELEEEFFDLDKSESARADGVSNAQGSADSANADGVANAQGSSESACADGVANAQGSAESARADGFANAQGSAESVHADGVANAQGSAESAYADDVANAQGSPESALADGVANAQVSAESAHANAQVSAESSHVDVVANAQGSAESVHADGVANAQGSAESVGGDGFGNAESSAEGNTESAGAYGVGNAESIAESACGDGVGNTEVSTESACADGVRNAEGSTETLNDTDCSFPWREELESLVRGGVPMALRGELWQAFVGVGARRVAGYYNKLLEQDSALSPESLPFIPNGDASAMRKHSQSPEKWKGQIEKDLPRTFPGHPALDENGRNALRRLLTAYARHNPLVGYCQAMNFFAGLLLLLMPEENAFWALIALIDDYFEGYYTEDMIESQVDQLVLEEVVRERFPKLVNHLDFLGVEVAWVTGPWFLSIFINMIPWESVLRVWDVILYEGNRTMLFRTTLALMELYGPALVTTKDAGDAVTLLQSLAGSTFDSSQLVLTACMGFQMVNELIVHDLRKKHRPDIVANMEERKRDRNTWKDKKGLATKLYSFKHDPASVLPQSNGKEEPNNTKADGDMHDLSCGHGNLEDYLNNLTETEGAPDLEEQVTWLKVELCKLLEEKRAAVLRSEELETALMEMVKNDNRRSLSAKVEQLEEEVSRLKIALADKQEQEQAMLQVLMKVEHEQRLTEDARIAAERDAAAQKNVARAMQEKYQEAAAVLAKMEKRAVMAETMLEATLQYQSGQNKAQQTFSPRINVDEASNRRPALLSRPFGLGWLDRSKGKAPAAEAATDSKPSDGSGGE